MGNLLRSCAEVREPIELSFGVVSGVSPGINVLDGGSRAPRGKGITRRFAPVCFSGVGAYFSHRNVFDSCVKS